MATAASAETLPKPTESVVKRDPLLVVESPDNKEASVEENSLKEQSLQAVQHKQSLEMEVDLTEDVVSPDNQT